MTAVFRCDSCSALLEADANRVEVELVNNEIIQEEPDEDSGDDHPLFELKVARFSFTGEHHFCNMACLASWAMGRHLEEAS